MTSKQVWLITGAGRGMGLYIAKAALAAGHNVVVTGRNPDKAFKAIGESANLLMCWSIMLRVFMQAILRN